MMTLRGRLTQKKVARTNARTSEIAIAIDGFVISYKDRPADECITAHHHLNISDASGLLTVAPLC